jgi:hypothetical protein
MFRRSSDAKSGAKFAMFVAKRFRAELRESLKTCEVVIASENKNRAQKKQDL